MKIAYKWKVFFAIGVSLFTSVASVSMVFVALSDIAYSFDKSLKDVSLVVIIHGLTICALILPMGRLADIVGRKKIFIFGLVISTLGLLFSAYSPSFSFLVFSRILTGVGNAMAQSVGTAMLVSVFPNNERGKAIGSQTTAVSIGAATGPVISGLVLQFYSWQFLFFLTFIPSLISLIFSYVIIDESAVSEKISSKNNFDWIGSLLSGIFVILFIGLINNPYEIPTNSFLFYSLSLLIIFLLLFFIFWELRIDNPMLQLRLFKNYVFTSAVLARFLGFSATTAVRISIPIYLITVKTISEASTGILLFFSSLFMGIAAQSVGRLADKFSERPFSILGFFILILTIISFSTFNLSTNMIVISFTIVINGFAQGLWNVPNSSTIMGSVPSSYRGVIGAFTNLTRNFGNVFGQAVIASVIAAVMISEGFDVPLDEIKNNPDALLSFLNGWRYAFYLIALFAFGGLSLSIFTKFTNEESK